jgi:FIMAH domain
MKNKIFFIFIIYMFGVFFSPSLKCQDSLYIFPSAKEIIVDVNANLSRIDTSFKYSYKIQSFESSKQMVYRWMLERRGTIYNIVHPDQWKGKILEHKNKVLSWSVSDSTSYLKPNQTLSGFSFNSQHLPGIVNCFIRGYFPLPVFPIGEEPEIVIGGDIYENSLIDFTIAPKDLPNPFVPEEFLDVLINYNNRSFDLGWVKGVPTYNKYNSYLTNAKTAIEQNDNNTARINLQSIIASVDVDSSSVLTSEAYALLRFNTEYLLEQLPEINIAGMFEKLILNINEYYTDGSINNKGIYNSLIRKAENAQKSYEEGKTKTAINHLNAFLNELEAQNGKHLTNEAYTLLKNNADYLIEKLTE